MSLFRLNFWQSYLKSAVKQNKWPYIFQLGKLNYVMPDVSGRKYARPRVLYIMHICFVCPVCSGWFHLACLFIHLIKYHRFGWCLLCGWIRGWHTHGYRGAALRARGVCVFLRSCFIRFDISFVLELHTCRHTSSCVLACLYAFKHFLFHAFLCLFILYIHIYVFPFHVFCSRCRKRICSP